MECSRALCYTDRLELEPAGPLSASVGNGDVVCSMWENRVFGAVRPERKGDSRRFCSEG